MTYTIDEVNTRVLRAAAKKLYDVTFSLSLTFEEALESNKYEQWIAEDCLKRAAEVLEAARDEENRIHAEQYAPKTHVSINPGSPTDFPIY